MKAEQKQPKKPAKPVDPEKLFMEQLKHEVAGELGLGSGSDWKQLSAKECGKVGGQMVRKLVKLAAQANANQSTAQ